MKFLGMESWHQFNLFACLYVGYMIYILNRKSFLFLIPTIIEKEGIDNNTIGTVVTCISGAYAISKFFSGVMVDKLSPRIMFATGLALTGIANILIGVSESVWFPILSFLIGLGQGPGWPACAKLMRSWFSSKIFGTLWSTLSTAMNVAASLGPLLCSIYTARNNGDWRWVMFFCGTVSCAYSAVSLLLYKDTPEEAGLILKSLNVEKSDLVDKTKLKQKEQTVKSAEKSISSKLKPESKKNIWNRILLSPYTYVISFGYLVSFGLKAVVTNWSALYMMQEKEASSFQTGIYLAYLEVGGVCGSLASGYGSDYLVAAFGSKKKGNPRHLMYSVWYFLLFVLLFLFRTTVHDVSSQQLSTLILGFLIGFFLYGNLSLSGVLTMENAADDLAGTAHACCSLAGNVGMMLSGLPFTMLMNAIGWDAALRLCELVSLAAGVVFVGAQSMHCRIGDIAKMD